LLRLARRLELLVGALELLVRGLELFVESVQLLVVRLELLDGGLMVVPQIRELLLELGCPVISLPSAVLRALFGRGGLHLLEDYQVQPLGPLRRRERPHQEGDELGLAVRLHPEPLSRHPLSRPARLREGGRQAGAEPLARQGEDVQRRPASRGLEELPRPAVDEDEVALRVHDHGGRRVLLEQGAPRGPGDAALGCLAVRGHGGSGELRWGAR
jgi:hypothetical protein